MFVHNLCKNFGNYTEWKLCWSESNTMFLSLILIKLKLDNFVNKVQSSSQLSATTPYCLIGNSTMGKRVSKSGNFKSYFVSWNEICIPYFWEVWAHIPDFPCFINFRLWWYKQSTLTIEKNIHVKLQWSKTVFWFQKLQII